MFWLCTLFHRSAVVDCFDLTSLSTAMALEAIRKLSPGNNQVLMLSVFDGSTISLGAAAIQQFGIELRSSIDLAHQKGYRVFGEWKPLEWKDVRNSPIGNSVLEFRSVNAFEHKPEYDFVSPLSPFVQKSLQDFADELLPVLKSLDVLDVNYRLPISPLFAAGAASRAAYIRDASIDPVDLIESLTLRRVDDPNNYLVNYLEWRISKSNEFLAEFLPRLSNGRGNQPTAFFADTLFATRPISERGASLNDWVTVIARLPKYSLCISFDGTTLGQEKVKQFAETLSALQLKPALWVISSEKSELLSQATIRRLEDLTSSLNILDVRK